MSPVQSSAVQRQSELSTGATHPEPGDTPSAPLRAGEVLLVVSIDTEEDNWVPARDGVTVDNIREIPGLHRLLTSVGIRPTYFVAHSVVADASSAAIIRELATYENVEIGSHLHPWNTPPLDEPFAPRLTMLHNLPAGLQRAKLERLTTALQECLGGRRPRTFRAGRWGIGSDTIGVLLDCGYTIDSSVTPYTSWVDIDEGPSHEGAPCDAYRLAAGGDVRRPVPGGPLIELPPSFGYNRGPFSVWSRVHRALCSFPGRALLLDRIASKTGFVRHVTLSPETDDVPSQLALTRAIIERGARYVQMYFHSPAVRPGLTPFVQSAEELDRFRARITEYVAQLASIASIRFATVSEAAALLRPR
jgi:peptidoglycan/xylan/chitin deacetylase (PgdA/CDA1 family)